MACADVADRVRPGELRRLVADGLTASGLDIRRPDGTPRHRLLIACPGAARCALAVSDCGLVEWECCPHAGRVADPKLVADLATALLTGVAGEFPRRGGGYGRPDATLKGIVGVELAARGLDVELEVYEDRPNFEARSLIVATNPAAADAAAVEVSDDGCVTWLCDFWDEASVAAEPGTCAPVPGPAEVAAAVVATVTTALSQGLPGTSVAGRS